MVVMRIVVMITMMMGRSQVIMVPMVSMVMRVTMWTTLAMARNDGDENC